MAFTPDAAAQLLDGALAELRTIAADSFKAAKDSLPTQKPSDPAKIAEWATAVATAKGQMASAVQQLVQADRMRWEMIGRQTVADVYAAVSTLVNSPIDPSNQTQINTLTGLLASLADIVPQTPAAGG